MNEIKLEISDEMYEQIQMEADFACISVEQMVFMILAHKVSNSMRSKHRKVMERDS